MEENQNINSVSSEPDKISDNSGETKNSPEVSEDLGQSASNIQADPNLILGKFKSQEDLIKAYQDLEKLQGNQSAELGELRQNAGAFRNLQDLLKLQMDVQSSQKQLEAAAQKYNKPEYFQDPSFREIYKQAYLALKENLDVDTLVNLLEGYVSGRISAHDRAKAAEAENAKALGGMKFDKNKNSSLNPSGKRIDQMSPQEIDAILDKYI